jgi:hypothetical protein
MTTSMPVSNDVAKTIRRQARSPNGGRVDAGRTIHLPRSPIRAASSTASGGGWPVGAGWPRAKVDAPGGCALSRRSRRACDSADGRRFCRTAGAVATRMGQPPCRRTPPARRCGMSWRGSGSARAEWVRSQLPSLTASFQLAPEVLDTCGPDGARIEDRWKRGGTTSSSCGARPTATNRPGVRERAGVSRPGPTGCASWAYRPSTDRWPDSFTALGVIRANLQVLCAARDGRCDR